MEEEVVEDTDTVDMNLRDIQEDLEDQVGQGFQASRGGPYLHAAPSRRDPPWILWGRDSPSAPAVPVDQVDLEDRADNRMAVAEDTDTNSLADSVADDNVDDRDPPL